MGTKTCGACHGTGGHYATERVPNPAGGMFQSIQVRRTCAMCGGSGSVYAPDPPATGVMRPVAGRTARAPAAPATPEEKDRDFASLLGLAAGGVLGYLAFFRDFQAETGVKWLITIGGAYVTYRIFDRLRGLTRVLRIATGIAILGAIVYFAVRVFSAGP